MFNILSLDGGGVRGAFIAAFLAKLEENLPLPTSRYFDLIAGTSTGGLIAVALAMNLRAEALRNFYREHAGGVFTRRAPAVPRAKRALLNACLQKYVPGV